MLSFNKQNEEPPGPLVPAPSEGPSEWVCLDWPGRAIASALYCAVLWFVFSDLLGMFVERWWNEPQYSHGFLIPIFAVALGLLLQERIPKGHATASRRGLFWIAGGIALHVVSRYLFIEFGDSIGFLLCVYGGIQLIWGRKFIRGVWPAVLFLAFMCPLPFRVERMLSAPLQLMGADYSAYYIQMCGIPAVARGNIILMGETKLGVAEACSGMRMLTVFVALATAYVIVSRRTVWEKTFVLLSSIPIALICNIARIVVTAIAHTYFGQRIADLIFHDLSGYLMIVAAIAMMYLELRILDWLFVPVPQSDDRLRSINPFGIPRVEASSEEATVGAES